MDDSFTDKLIKDLNKSERDARGVGVNKWSVLKEVIREFADSSATVALFTLIVLPILFGRSTFVLISTINKVPALEESVFQIFEARGIAVEAMNLNDPTLSGVLEEVGVNFLELVELAQQNEMVYYNRKPENRFFVVSDYGDVIHYYINERLYSAYENKGFHTLVFPLSGGLVLVVGIYIHKEYRSKYKEMAGF